jgi:hypothetical protein
MLKNATEAVEARAKSADEAYRGRIMLGIEGNEEASPSPSPTMASACPRTASALSNPM